MITELNTTQGRQEDDWTINVYETDASAGIVLRPSTVGHRHGIKSITITANDNEKVEILNGTEPFIGPLHLEKGFPWVLNIDDVIYGTRGNALVLKTESEIQIHCLIAGVTDTSPEQAYNPNPVDGAVGVSTGAVLSWAGSAIYHKVYFGTSSQPEFVIAQESTTYSPGLTGGITYYWRIDECDGVSTTEGDVWSFTTL